MSHKKEKPQIITCYDCENSYLMRSAPVNPIVAECSETKERNVAGTPHPCFRYKKRVKPPSINPMIPVKR